MSNLIIMWSKVRNFLNFVRYSFSIELVFFLTLVVSSIYDVNFQTYWTRSLGLIDK